MSIIPNVFYHNSCFAFSAFCHISRKKEKFNLKFVINGENEKNGKFFEKMFAFFFTMLYNGYDG